LLHVLRKLFEYNKIALKCISGILNITRAAPQTLSQFISTSANASNDSNIGGMLEHIFFICIDNVFIYLEGEEEDEIDNFDDIIAYSPESVSEDNGKLGY